MKVLTMILLSVVTLCSNADCNNKIKLIAPDGRYYLLNGGAEVKDIQTGLIWQRCSLGQTWNGTDCIGNAATYNWANALQTAKNMGNDWRVPNVNELRSLVEYACNRPAINETFFPATQIENYYWSSSFGHQMDSMAWLVFFKEGNTIGILKSSNAYVRLVRFSQ